MLGDEQEQWLDRQLAAANARWTIVAQQTLMAELVRPKETERRFWLDGWDGYPNARRRLLDSIASRKPRNPVVNGGDRHAFYVADLKRDFAQAGEPVVASEFVGTSITSQGPSAASMEQALKFNPQLKYGRGDRRGYATVDLTAARCTVGFEAVDDVKQKDSPVHRLATFVVEDGVTGAKPA
jgi:alkaline phosphatase D